MYIKKKEEEVKNVVKREGLTFMRSSLVYLALRGISAGTVIFFICICSGTENAVGWVGEYLVSFQ